MPIFWKCCNADEGVYSWGCSIRSTASATPSKLQMLHPVLLLPRNWLLTFSKKIFWESRQSIGYRLMLDL